ncbi:MAG TPA: 5-(carboxyamino)imidazole ribonucleotide synthase [Thermomicrobiales bacterium]|nr:5-(carboxyamino)imidazole ribonucleotide synthase [Thermomicrobiales bacterium]
MQYRVGIIGAGQLARMMAQAAIPLGIEVTLLAASADDGAARVVRSVIVGSPDDPDRVRELAARVDVITFDHELVDPGLLDVLEAEGHAVHPRSPVMRLAQNKRLQREAVDAAGLPGPAWAAIGSIGDLDAFAATHGWPVVLKAARGGYDGRGVWKLDARSEAQSVVEGALGNGTELIVEAFQRLDGEVAVIVARTPGGECRVYPATETVQRDGICHELHIPARFGENVSCEAEMIARDVAEMVGSTGLLAIEFFVTDGRVLINELAPRPHNSGHWTIEGAETSQFEQHLRAVLDWPLGDTAQVAASVVTRNLLGPDGGDPFARIPHALATDGGHIHWYGKESRPGRKIGHITARASNHAEAERRATAVWQVLMHGAGEQG